MIGAAWLSLQRRGASSDRSKLGAVDVYGQDAEIRLMRALQPQLKSATMIDVGAEQGAVAEQMLQAGVEKLYAFDPHPDNARALRARFARDPRVTIFEHAVSSTDGAAQLHVSTRPDGSPLPFGHTLLERENTAEIAWTDELSVTRRSLQSSLDSGEIPRRVGVLKIDTEGHDYAVVEGMGELRAEIVIVEHWTDLPNGLGRCPWSTSEMTSALADRGFRHFAFIVHRGEFVTVKWNDGEVEPGAMGNLLFLHESVESRLLPELLACAGALAEEAVRTGQDYMRAATDRSVLLDEFKQIADERLAMIEEVTKDANERLAIMERLEGLASERLARIRELERLAPTA
jgi:FkbM family methyltransferase